MARKNLSNEIQHDGAADTFLARQGEGLRHWAAPKVESALAWAEASAAFGEIGGKAAATEGRRFAEKEVAPKVKDTSERVNAAVQDRYEKVAPVVAGVGSSLQDLLVTAQDKAQQVGQDLQDRAEQTRKDAAQAAKRNRKAAKKAAKRGGKRTAALQGSLKKDARGVAKKASQAKDSAAQGGLTVAGLLAAAVAAAQDKSQELAPQVRARLDQAQHFAQDRREEYVPKAAATLAGVADRAEKGAQDFEVPASVEQLLVALTGDKAAVKHLRKSAQQTARQAKKDLQKRAEVESGSNGRAWILVGMALTAAGAGYAVWKLTTPVQDPWAAPVPGPITANIPVVHSVEGSTDPYAKQKQAVAEANGAVLGGGARLGQDAARTEAIDVRPQVQQGTLANETPEARR